MSFFITAKSFNSLHRHRLCNNLCLRDESVDSQPSNASFYFRLSWVLVMVFTCIVWLLMVPSPKLKNGHISVSIMSAYWTLFIRRFD